VSMFAKKNPSESKFAWHLYRNSNGFDYVVCYLKF
jgi:hypothetical protein